MKAKNVIFNEQSGKYFVRIRSLGRYLRYGTFNTFEEAVEVANAARLEVIKNKHRERIANAN